MKYYYHEGVVSKARYIDIIENDTLIGYYYSYTDFPDKSWQKQEFPFTMNIDGKYTENKKELTEVEVFALIIQD